MCATTTQLLFKDKPFLCIQLALNLCSSCFRLLNPVLTSSSHFLCKRRFKDINILLSIVVYSHKLSIWEVRREDQQLTIILGYMKPCLKKELDIVPHTCDSTYQRWKRGGSGVLQVQPESYSKFETRLGCMRHHLTHKKPQPYKQNHISI